ncbi:MAG: DNA polymerase III subunit delta [Pseudomonadota bacterium]
MAQCKAHEVDRFLNRPDPTFKTILIYGPDTGLVAERAKQFADKSGVDLNDPFSLISIDAESAASDKLRIADEANTIGMFGGKRLIWVRGSTQKNLSAAVQMVLDQPPDDAFLLLEAGDLKKSSPLRTKVERSKSGMALPCFQDEAKALDQVIEQELHRSSLTIEPEARQLLTSLLGSNRLASRSEVQKLCLYAKDKTAITDDDVLAIVGDASALATDTYIDATATGNLTLAITTLLRLLQAGTHPTVVAGSLLRHFQMLHRARSAMETKGLSAQAAIGAMRPPPNFKRKPLLTQAINSWSLELLNEALFRIDTLNLSLRRNAGLAEVLLSEQSVGLILALKRKRFL